jgi:MoaA/NifB/PqqE/SkfB family radical SAM enzyme
MKNHKNMSLDLFKKLIPYAKYTDLIYLQGWGEPLLNKDIFEMIRICKNKGKRVGFTTNGMLLNETNMQKLIDLNLDILCISLAGIKSSTHNRIRKGTNLNKLFSNIELLNKIKYKNSSPLPALHFAYLMLNSNISELSNIIPLAKRFDVKQIVASNLTLIINNKTQKEALFNKIGKKNNYIEILEKIKEKAKRENIVFAYSNPFINNSNRHCNENIYKSCFVSVSGIVSPCVFSCSTLCNNEDAGEDKKHTKIFNDKEYPIYAKSFGEISSTSLTQIWNELDYFKFRNFFYPKILTKPEFVLSKMPDCCNTCYKRLAV